MAQNGVSTEDQDPTDPSSRLMSRDRPTGEGVDVTASVAYDAAGLPAEAAIVVDDFACRGARLF
jgi:hypothetical protein